MKSIAKKFIVLSGMFAAVFAVFAVGVITFGCSVDDFNQNHHVKTQAELEFDKIIEVKGIEFVDNQYYITINEEQALRLGVSAETYREVCSEIEKGNEMLREMIEQFENDPTVTSFIIEDQTYNREIESEIDYRIPLFKTRAEVGPGKMPAGSIVTSGQETGRGSCWAPREMKSIIGSCFSRVAPAAVSTVTTRTQATLRSGFRIGNGTVSVPLVASNTSCDITFSTTDANGGMCNWSGAE